MARKTDTAEAEGAPAFGCVILADRGGVGKTATAALIWATLVELGHEARLGEVEGATERKLSALMKEAQAGSPDPNITTPTPAECTADPRANARAFAPALRALTAPNKATIIDNGATVSRAYLDAAEAAEHGDETDGGQSLRIVVVAKAEDAQSAVSAEASLRRARAIYPNARIVLVVTHVRVNRQTGEHNAGAVVSTVEAGGKASAVVLIPLLNSPYMGELYGEQHIPFHVLAGLPAGNVAALLGADEMEVRIYRGQFLIWYNQALASLAAALELPAPPARTGKVARPLETSAAA